MHNLHLVKVRANSGEQACKEVNSLLYDFGNENNWREFGGAVSEDNEVYDTNEGRYTPNSTDYTTIEKINECVNEWIKSSWYGETARLKFEKGETDLSQWDSHELWSLSKLADHLSEAHPFRERPFDCMKDDCFFSYKYDECGLTDLTHSTSDGDKVWFVFVDMHS